MNPLLHQEIKKLWVGREIFMTKDGAIVTTGSTESTLREDNLSKLYNIEVGVLEIPNRRFIYPITK